MRAIVCMGRRAKQKQQVNSYYSARQVRAIGEKATKAVDRVYEHCSMASRKYVSFDLGVGNACAPERRSQGFTRRTAQTRTRASTEEMCDSTAKHKLHGVRSASCGDSREDNQRVCSCI